MGIIAKVGKRKLKMTYLLYRKLELNFGWDVISCPNEFDYQFMDKFVDLHAIIPDDSFKEAPCSKLHEILIPSMFIKYNKIDINSVYEVIFKNFIMPKTLLKILIDNWERSWTIVFEQELRLTYLIEHLDEIYDQIMIKDIIE
jgi:hypothetical protein